MFLDPLEKIYRRAIVNRHHPVYIDNTMIFVRIVLSSRNYVDAKSRLQADYLDGKIPGHPERLLMKRQNRDPAFTGVASP